MSLNDPSEEGVSVQKCKAASPEHSCVSMKSDISMNPPPKLSDGVVTSDPDSSVCSMSLYDWRKEGVTIQKHKAESPECSCVSMKSDISMNPPPKLSDGVVTSDPDSSVCRMSLYEWRKDGVTVQKHKAETPEPSCVSMKRYRSMNDPPVLSDGAVTSDPKVKRVKDQHKTSMKNKYERLFEGIIQQGNQTLLNSIYTQLYILEGRECRSE